MRAAHRCAVEPCRAISPVNRVTSIRVSTGAVTATAIERARSVRAWRRPSRDRIVRDSCSISVGCAAVSDRNASTLKRASVLSRRAVTVAPRGARSIIPTSPTTSPRAISPISVSPRDAANRPLTTRYPASDGAPSSNSTSPAGRCIRSLDSTTSAASVRSIDSSSATRATVRWRSMRDRATSATAAIARSSDASQRWWAPPSSWRTTDRSTARTVAVRGQPASEAISPIVVPGPTMSMRSCAGPRSTSNDPSTTK